MSLTDPRPPPDALDVPEFLTILQAATVVGVSRRTIYNWLDKSLVEFHRTPGGAVRILASSLIKPGRP